VEDVGINVLSLFAEGKKVLSQ